MTTKPPVLGRSLAERFPAVAATWDSAANGAGPETVTAHMGREAHWCCPAGHTWVEAIQTRTRLDGWKGGDIAACRFCTGYWVEVTFQCGHTAVDAADRAAFSTRLCPACRKVKHAAGEVAWEARREQGRARAAELKPQCVADARLRADELWAERSLDRLPAFLHKQAHAALIAKLTFHLLGERAFGAGHADEVEILLNDYVRVIDGVTDTDTQGPLDLVGTRFWAPSLAHGPVPTAKSEPDVLASLAAAAQTALRLEGDAAWHLRFELMVARAYEDAEAKAATAELTRVLTDALKQWAFERGWRSWRELHVPLDNGRATGRLDLVVFRPDMLDIVVEIDSQNVERSRSKLELARNRGALTVWLRWRGGIAAPVAGVHVLDLTGVPAAA